MSTIESRLQAAREAAGYAKPVDAIRALGFSEYTYYQHENGTRPPSKAALEKYAKAYRVSLDWLWSGTGEMKGGMADPDTAEVVGIMRKIMDEKTKREIVEFAKFKAAQAKPARK